NRNAKALLGRENQAREDDRGAEKPERGRWNGMLPEPPPAGEREGQNAEIGRERRAVVARRVQRIRGADRDPKVEEFAGDERAPRQRLVHDEVLRLTIVDRFELVRTETG